MFTLICYFIQLHVFFQLGHFFNSIDFLLFRLGYPEKAAYYFKEALQRNDNYFPAYRSLSTTYCALIERWHYRMLNDSFRNEAYKEAIHKKINQGFNHVLDIGTGTGLFWYKLEVR